MTVQHIYYPGFTIAGLIGEAGGFFLVLLLLILTPPVSSVFWLVLAALFGMCGMQAVYWVVTHPTNKYWMHGEKLQKLGSVFFSVGRPSRVQLEGGDAENEWIQLRKRWEYSHVARAAFSVLSSKALVIGLRV